jgi:hypothetical protein
MLRATLATLGLLGCTVYDPTLTGGAPEDAGAAGYGGSAGDDVSMPSTTTAAGFGGSGPDGRAGGAGGAGGFGVVDASDADAGSSGGGAAGSTEGGADVSSPRCPTCRVGLVLYWKLDEASGSLALDSSPNGFNGSYSGVIDMSDAALVAPTPSSMVPPKVTFSDPFSRAFDGTGQQGVLLTPLPSALQPRNSITLAAWYRATRTDSNGGEIISAGDSYILRLRPTLVELVRFQPTPDAASNYIRCTATPANFLDGNWHHLAGEVSPAGMQVYFDGVSMCTNTLGADLAYTGYDSFVVGHHARGRTDFDYDGNIDEVRVYNRVLSNAEIAGLASGSD